MGADRAILVKTVDAIDPLVASRVLTEVARKGKLEALVHGNVTAGDAITATRRLSQSFGTQGVADADLLRRLELIRGAGAARMGMASAAEAARANIEAYRASLGAEFEPGSVEALLAAFMTIGASRT